MLRNLIPPRLQSVLQKRPPGGSGRWGQRALILGGFILEIFPKELSLTYFDGVLCK